jgi:metal-sulfur cluster biosynthetic enzyme
MGGVCAVGNGQGRPEWRRAALQGAYTAGVIAPTKEDVVEALRGAEDPELGMDIVELGLMYDVELDGSKVKVIHSLTSMGCPAGQMIEEGIRDAAGSVPGVEQVDIELVWDPPWTPDRMSDDAKFILGFG